MLNVRHILRLHSQNQTLSEIIVQTGIHRGTLKRIIREYKESKLTFEDIDELSDEDIQDLFKQPDDNIGDRLRTLYSLFPHIDRELKRIGVTKMLLWEEYRQKHPDGVGKSAFLHHFSQWKARSFPVMRMNHKAGDKMYIDFAGNKLNIVDEVGRIKLVEVFVAILGASQLTYVEAVHSQKKEDFIPACENALQYYGGSPAAIVCDNLRSAVTASDKYEPTINETFADFAEHYNTTVVPARAYKPKDKALVEIAVNIIYKRIYARLRDQTFHSIEELNEAILKTLEDHNDQIITGKNYSRRQQFETVEKQTLTQLPINRYEFKKQLSATVAKHGHVALGPDRHYYSVPHQYIGKKVKVTFTPYKVEIYYNYERIALHKRWQTPYKYTTDVEHLPANHKFVAELEPDKLLRMAEELHPDVKFYVSCILDQKIYPERAYKMCTGVIQLSKKYGIERLARACTRAVEFGIFNYKTVKKILENNLETTLGEADLSGSMPQHTNIRGNEYYV
jgi:transposase